MSSTGMHRVALAGALAAAFAAVFAPAASALRPYPILFVTQVPLGGDFAMAMSSFGNQQASVAETGRGGDLYLLMPNGALRNLTGEAGLGVASGFQGESSIAVRDPCVNWDATHAVFSMATGAPEQQFLWETYYWRMYEVTNLQQVLLGATPTIALVPNQPMTTNNVTPCYTSDGKILFTTDRSRSGQANLYPQLDEYEEQPTVSGVWVLDPSNGALRLLNHSPSGDFTPIVDSFGRVIFTQWDHLQRDQQADADFFAEQGGGSPPYGTFNWSSENPALGVPLNDRSELYPEPRSPRTDLLPPNLNGHEFNQFFPWMVNQDGTELETVNHIGRHELASYFIQNFNDDPNLVEFIAAESGRTNPNSIRNFMEIRESATQAGLYVGIDAPDFYQNAAGQLISLSSPPGADPDFAVANWLTHPSTANFADPPDPCHSGFYRNPLVLADGTTIVVHAGERSPGVPETRAQANDGTRANPVARYHFRLRGLVADSGGCAGYQKYDSTLTGGITKTLSYFDPDVLVSYTSVTMYEISPVEVRPRAVPPMPSGSLPAPEAGIFTAQQVDPNIFRQYLRDHDLALIVSRNVTTRDQADKQQPYNLHVDQTGGATTTGAGGTIYNIKYLQLVEGDLIRGLGGYQTPGPGRRVLAQTMHTGGHNPPPTDGSAPAGSVEISADGSMAALVPAHRALSWQLTDDPGDPKIRERYWLTFQDGEIRVCADCHGVNTHDQAGNPPASNPPQALAHLLQYWKTIIFDDNFESGTTALWSATAP